MPAPNNSGPVAPTATRPRLTPSPLEWLEIDPPVGTHGTSYLTGLEEPTRQLANHLAAAESRRLETSVEEVPPKTVEQMRALGYVE